MSSAASLSVDLSASVRQVSSRAWILVLLAAGLGVGAFVLPDPMHRLGAISGAAALCLLAVAIRLLAARDKARLRRQKAQIAALVEEDAAPCFTTDADGEISFQNAAAVKRFAALNGQTLVAALGDHFVSPGAVLYRLQSRAATRGSAREDIVTRRGHTRLSVHRVAESGFLWRVEEMLERNAPGRGAEALSLPMLVSNKAGVVLFMNEAMRRLLGGRPRRLDRIFTDATLRSGEETVVSTLDGPVRAILAEIEGAGERRELYLLPMPDQAAATVVRAEFDNLPVALAMLGSDGAIEVANAAAREILRLPDGATAHLSDFLEGLGRSLSDWIGDVLAERLPGATEVMRVRHGDTDRFVQVTLRRIVETGRPLALAVFNDATALKSLEAQFAQSQKMHAIGQFAGGIAHDLNNVLTAISGHCDLLLLRRDITEPEYDDLVQIHQNSNRAANLVRQLLAYSRKQTMLLERVDVYEVLSGLTHLLNRLMGEKMRLSLRHAPNLGPIRADKSQLEQVLVNLTTNARDAMGHSGTIEVLTDQVTLAQALRRDSAFVPPGDYAVISVIDRGHGIPPDQLEKIFEPFYTTKRVGEGTGLGLSTAYGIVKQMGGFIFVDSEVGVGTTFLLYFPINEDPVEIRSPEPTARPSPRQISRQGGEVVLLVEDEAAVRTVASRALRLRGYTVLEAENAEAALELLDNPAVDVDIFVTDVVMPGMDGPSWVSKALERRPNVKVVFLSGYAEDSFADTLGRIANSVFLPKPFSLSELTATVQGQLLH